jgi:hypothetical protein
LFRVALRRLDLAAEIYHIKEPQKIPLVMSPDEAKRLVRPFPVRQIARIKQLVTKFPASVNPSE